MYIHEAGRSQKVSKVNLREAETLKSTQKAALNFPKQVKPVEKFNQLLKQTPLGESIPTSKWLNKKGFKDVSAELVGTSAGHTKRYVDKKGNVIQITTRNNNTTVEYFPKDASFHQTVTYNPDGVAKAGEISTIPTKDGIPVETFKYNYNSGKLALE